MTSIERMPLKVLFVCKFNMMRSATAEMIFRGDPLLEVRSAGISPEALLVISRELVDWADVIFVMESSQKRFIEKKFPKRLSGGKIICLSIEDHYPFMDQNLQEVLRSRIEPHLKKILNQALPSDRDDRYR